MSILDPSGVSPSSPHCDWLDLTFPVDLCDEVASVVDRGLVRCYGATRLTDGLWQLQALRRAQGDREAGLIFEKRPRMPTIRLDRIRQVSRLSISGQAAVAMQAQDVWPHLLLDLGAFPHKLTRTDAAADFPLDAPTVLPSVVAVGRSGELALGRKRVKPQDVRTVMALTADGRETGTVYLRQRSAEISARVYDKRQEREDAGLDDLGPCTRVELSLRDVGCTLRDAAAPAALFWHYGSTLVTAPQGAPEWSREALGFDLPPLPPVDHWKLLNRRVEALTELHDLGRIADHLGPYGRSLLLGLLARVLGVKGGAENVAAA